MLTVRLTAGAERAIATLARRRGQSRSDVVRDAIDHYAATHRSAGARPLDHWSDVIGIVARRKTRGRQTTGQAFTAIVRAKADARRPR